MSAKNKGWQKGVIKDIVDRGFVRVDDVFYPPGKAPIEVKQKKKRVKGVKTGWIDDTRNLKNKERIDVFTRLIFQELGLEVWPEFFFSTERQYRIDYAIPSIKVAIEVDGGIWAKGNSGHSSGTGIMRDQDKGNLLNAGGWRLIRTTPDRLQTIEILNLVRQYKDAI